MQKTKIRHRGKVYENCEYYNIHKISNNFMYFENIYDSDDSMMLGTECFLFTKSKFRKLREAFLEKKEMLYYINIPMIFIKYSFLIKLMPLIQIRKINGLYYNANKQRNHI